MRSANIPFDRIMVGASIAGLTAALGLQQKGHKVIVLERQADTQAVGGPINMSPSATRILTQHGLKERIYEELGHKEKSLYFRRFEDGRQLGVVPPGATEEMYATGWVGIHPERAAII